MSIFTTREIAITFWLLFLFMATFIDVEPEVVEKINGLFDDAITVDDELIAKMNQQFYFKHIVDKCNKIYKIQMPKITLHVCRHTYCSNMAKSRMNLKNLQYLMGHSDIGVTLNTYTHLDLRMLKKKFCDCKKPCKRDGKSPQTRINTEV